MKTNRELFTEQLADADMSRFLDLLDGVGKCSRCSNNYWDGNQMTCHKNINDSSCKLGQSQYMKAYPTDNLQMKYHKKYYCFKDAISANIARDVMHLLYSSRTVEDPQKVVKHCSSGCHAATCTATSCYMHWQNIMNLRDAWALETTRKECDIDDEAFIREEADKLIRETPTMKYIYDVLSETISDVEVKSRVKTLIEMYDQYLKSIDFKEE